MAILNPLDSISSGDLLVIWSNADSPPYFGVNISTLAAVIEPLLTNAGTYSTQYASPSATGFSVSIVAGSSGQTDIHLILTPLAGYANGTIVLPLASLCADGQRLQVNCTQAVTTLAITANGASDVIGAPTTLAANAFFTLAFDMPSLNWYRVS